jgi:hypothetical protein
MLFLRAYKSIFCGSLLYPEEVSYEVNAIPPHFYCSHGKIPAVFAASKLVTKGSKSRLLRLSGGKYFRGICTLPVRLSAIACQITENGIQA